jgi:hypothetical protein
MKTIAMMVSALTLTCAGIGSAEAQRLNYPYCAVYSSRTMSCAFNTMQQCLMTVRGVGGFCEANAWYQPPAKAKSRKKSS